MNHDDDTILDELISAYFDGQLSGAEKSRAEQLLQDDARARQILDEYKTLRDELQSLPTVELDSSFSQQILDQIAETENKVDVRQTDAPANSNVSSRPLRNWYLLTATIAASAAAILLMWRPPQWNDHSDLAKNGATSRFADSVPNDTDDSAAEKSSLSRPVLEEGGRQEPSLENEQLFERLSTSDNASESRDLKRLGDESRRDLAKELNQAEMEAGFVPPADALTNFQDKSDAGHSAQLNSLEQKQAKLSDIDLIVEVSVNESSEEIVNQHIDKTFVKLAAPNPERLSGVVQDINSDWYRERMGSFEFGLDVRRSQRANSLSYGRSQSNSPERAILVHASRAEIDTALSILKDQNEQFSWKYIPATKPGEAASSADTDLSLREHTSQTQIADRFDAIEVTKDALEATRKVEQQPRAAGAGVAQRPESLEQLDALRRKQGATLLPSVDESANESNNSRYRQRYTEAGRGAQGKAPELQSATKASEIADSRGRLADPSETRQAQKRIDMAITIPNANIRNQDVPMQAKQTEEGLDEQDALRRETEELQFGNKLRAYYFSENMSRTLSEKPLRILLVIRRSVDAPPSTAKPTQKGAVESGSRN